MKKPPSPNERSVGIFPHATLYTVTGKPRQRCLYAPRPHVEPHAMASLSIVKLDERLTPLCVIVVGDEALRRKSPAAALTN